MCGRFVLADPEALPTRFQVAGEVPRLSPRYNLAPGSLTPVIVRQGATNAVALMRWGLIPKWAKTSQATYALINAKAEGLHQHPAYRGPLRSRRCLVPATGFYEWRQTERGKLPYYVTLKPAGLFALAGLYDIWQQKLSGEEIRSYAIITTEANELVKPIHDRMPVILEPDDEATWLDPSQESIVPLLKLLRPYPADQMVAYPVSREVNRPDNDYPELLLRLAT